MVNFPEIENKAKKEMESRARRNLEVLASTKSYDLLPMQFRELTLNSKYEADIFEDVCDLKKIPCYRRDDTECIVGGSYEILCVRFGDREKYFDHPYNVRLRRKYERY